MTATTGQHPTLPNLGFGLRLRNEYLPQVIAERPAVDWFEIISEGYLDAEPAVFAQLLEVRRHYPLVMHGISLGIGSPWPLDRAYLQALKKLMQQLQPAWISDHLSWSGADDLQGQLLTMPYSQDMLDHLIPRIEEVQQLLGRQILLENVPSRPGNPIDEISEAEFLSEVAERSDSLILIDIANLHSTSVSRNFDPGHYLAQLPADRVQQLHLAGAVNLCAKDRDDADTMTDPLWELYCQALKLFGPTTTMIERVDTIPSLAQMVAEIDKARHSLATDHCIS